MSMYVNLVNAVKKTVKVCNLTDDQAVELLISVFNATTLDLDNVDYNSNIWPDQTRIAAKKELGIPH